MATEPSASASAPQPAVAKPAAAASKGPSFVIPLFILATAIAVAIGIGFLYDERRGIEWFVQIIFRISIPAVVVYLAFYFIKEKIDGH